MSLVRPMRLLWRRQGLSLGPSTRSTVLRTSSALELSSDKRGFCGTGSRFRDSLQSVKITVDGVEFDGDQLESPKRRKLPSLWLRDNCRCSECVNQDTRQRNFNTFAIPSDIQPKELKSSERGVTVTWPDGHRSEYQWNFLRYYQNFDYRDKENDRPHLWGSETASSPPTISYDRVMSQDQTQGERAVAEMTAKIKEYGLVFVSETPYDDPEKTKALLERIAFIRLTHYGGFYDFTPDLAMADTAYTNLALPAHTDTTYFTDPAGLQAFHMLSHHPPPDADPNESVEGGESLLVDGFKAASVLQEEDPEAYKILSKVRLPWHASGNEGITIAPDRRYPVLELDEDTGELHRVRWNNDDRGIVPFDDQYSPTEWYEAARKWDSILRRKDIECWIQLEPGKPVIFDNWRVLHGRAAFTGIRRICGAYINRDDFISRWRNTNFERGKILERIVG